MKIQEGFLTIRSGAYLGNYSRWITLPNGDRKRQQRAWKIGPCKSMTKTEAKQRLRKRVTEELGITTDSRTTFGWFVQNVWLPLKQGKWRESTKAVNAELLRPVLARFGATALEDMTDVEMQSWLDSLVEKYSASYIIHCHIFLKSICKTAHRKEYTRKDIAEELSRPNADSMREVNSDFLEIEEVKKLMACVQPPQDWGKPFLERDWHDYTMESTLLTLMLLTALRPAEVFGLRWGFYNDKERTMKLAQTVYRGVTRDYTKTTRKGEKQRITMNVPDDAAVALEQWRERSSYTLPEDYIFPSSSGTMLDKNNYLRRVLRPLGKKAGIKKRLTFQVLRRTSATWLQHTGSPTDIKEILRHRKVATSQDHYIKAISETVKSAQEALAVKLLS